MKRKVFSFASVIGWVFCCAIAGGASQPAGITLNPYGTSYIYPPFDSPNWIMTQGPEVGQVLHDHDGDDYYAQDWAIGCFSEGKKVFAGISGTILLNRDGDGNQDYYGNSVIICDTETGFAVRYGHLQEFAAGLSHGQYIDAGRYIGKVGHTGYCVPSQQCASQGGRGAHLHVVVYKNVWNISARPVWSRTDFNSSGSTRRSTSYAARFGYASSEQLVKGQNDATVYAIKNGLRYPVSWFVFNNQGWNFDRNHTVFTPVSIWPDWQINQYQDSYFCPPRNGSLVRGSTLQTVFLIAQEKKFAVSSQEFQCRGFRTTDVATVDQNECNRYPDGTSVPDLTGCGSVTDPNDAQAKTDMQQRATYDWRFFGAIEGSFGKDINWDPSWELRWQDFNFYNNRRVTMYHATAKWDRTYRLTGFTDPDTGQWTDWQQAY